MVTVPKRSNQDIISQEWTSKTSHTVMRELLLHCLSLSITDLARLAGTKWKTADCIHLKQLPQSTINNIHESTTMNCWSQTCIQFLNILYCAALWTMLHTGTMYWLSQLLIYNHFRSALTPRESIRLCN